jgi:signal-transduction protein with cAMP-binding, CBS, and nucleotidyltransferase domain
MFDFDVLGISETGEPQPDDVLALGTVHLGAAVGSVPRGPALTLAPEISVAGAIEAMRRSKRGAAVVIRQQRPVGLVTDHDLLTETGAGDPHEISIVTVMTACHHPLRATDTVGAALRRMCATRQWHQALVCGKGLLLGSIDIADISLWMRDRMTLLSVDAALGTSWASIG